MQSSSGQTALVTGTSSGIGLSTALALAKAGFHVYATMRDLSKAQPLRDRAQQEGVSLDIRRLDVSDDTSVATTINAIMQQYGHLDLVINNAGAGYLGTTEQTPLSDVKQVFDVNFFGVWRVTQAVLPYMRQAHSGRIISISSMGGVIGQPFNDAYNAAKFALEGMMECLAPVASQFGVAVSLVEPGPVNTEFLTNVGGLMKQPTQSLVDDPYRLLIEGYMAAAQSAYAGTGQTGDEVAHVIVQAAQAEQPHFRYQTSSAAQNRAAQKLIDPTGDGQIQAMNRLFKQ